MELYIIRHGQSTNNLNFALTNSYRNRVEDPELTELGRLQAEALAELRQRHSAETDRVAIVTHGDFYRTVIVELLNIPPAVDVHFQLANTAVSRIDLVGDRTDVHYLNRTDHLSADLV